VRRALFCAVYLLCLLVAERETPAVDFTLSMTEAPQVITSGGGPYFSLQDAYGATPDHGTIFAREGSFPETLTIARPVTVFLKGGLDGSFTTRTGYTVLNGRCNIRAGTLIADGLAISYPKDVTPPAPPANVTAAAASATTAALSWSPSINNVGVAGYEIFRGGVKVATSTTTSSNDSVLTPSTTYCYRIAAYDAAGNISSLSNEACASLPASVVPVSLTVSPDNAIITGSHQFFASATMSDGSTADVTSSVAWSTSDSTVAAVSTGGLVTAIGEGAVTITATTGTASDSTVAIMNHMSSANEMEISVNGALCSPGTSTWYINKPCVSVTICTPGTLDCQTISDILLDSGSYGLRIFGSAITVPLTQSRLASRDMGECVHFADGSSAWGPIKMADVVLAGESPVRVPIHVIDPYFGNSSVCGYPDATPQDAGYHGILGVGVYAEDCGSGCEYSAGNGMYFTCLGTSCAGAAVPIANQVQNPVAAQAVDNNGIAIKLPAVPDAGAASVTGSLLFGIGTQPNNAPGSGTTFDISTTGYFPTFFTAIGGTTYPSFLDTGSNGIFLPASGSFVPVCDPYRDWFCPASVVTFNATGKSGSGLVSAPFSFSIGNATSLFSSGNSVFGNLGGPNAGSQIDFGLPFFLGRDVFIGYEGKSSILGTGPFWRY